MIVFRLAVGRYWRKTSRYLGYVRIRRTPLVERAYADTETRKWLRRPIPRRKSRRYRYLTYPAVMGSTEPRIVSQMYHSSVSFCRWYLLKATSTIVRSHGHSLQIPSTLFTCAICLAASKTGQPYLKKRSGHVDPAAGSKVTRLQQWWRATMEPSQIPALCMNGEDSLSRGGRRWDNHVP